MNLIFSYSRDTDFTLQRLGHKFIGAGEDRDGGEVHVFLDKESDFAPQYCEPKEDPKSNKECRNEIINSGATCIPRSCPRCGISAHCAKGVKLESDDDKEKG